MICLAGLVFVCLLLLYPCVLYRLLDPSKIFRFLYNCIHISLFLSAPRIHINPVQDSGAVLTVIVNESNQTKMDSALATINMINQRDCHALLALLAARLFGLVFVYFYPSNFFDFLSHNPWPKIIGV